VVNTTVYNKDDINYLKFEFFQLCDTAGITSIIINSVSPKQLEELSISLMKLSTQLENK
jgi:hypothetical protein